MKNYIAIVGDYEQEFKTTKKAEVKKFALQAIKDGAESVDIYYNDMSSYLGTFYADGEMPRIFKK